MQNGYPHATENLHVTPDNKPVEPISVFIKKSQQERFFFCNYCRNGLFKYNGAITNIIPGNAAMEGSTAMKFPMKIKCKGHSAKWGDCPALYIIEGYVVEE